MFHFYVIYYMWISLLYVNLKENETNLLEYFCKVNPKMIVKSHQKPKKYPKKYKNVFQMIKIWFSCWCKISSDSANSVVASVQQNTRVPVAQHRSGKGLIKSSHQCFILFHHTSWKFTKTIPLPSNSLNTLLFSGNFQLVLFCPLQIQNHPN